MALTLHGTVADNTVVLDRRSAKPLIINGDMAVSQRGTSFSPSGNTDYYSIDRFAYFATSGATGDATITQASDAPSGTGFKKSIKISPDATETPSGTHNMCFGYAFEGQDVQVLQHGQTSPEKVTLAFWVKSSKTGTYCVQIKEEGITDESYLLFEYAISSANTWEKKIISWTGNSAHAINNDNTQGYRIIWMLASGSSDHASATTSWTVSSSFKATSNQVNFFDSTSNEWYLTGVQLEVGEFDANSIAPFQHESFGDSLLRCQRYLPAYIGTTSNFRLPGAGIAGSTTLVFLTLNHPVTTRVKPSGVVVSDAGHWSGGVDGILANQAMGSVAYGLSSTFATRLTWAVASGTPFTARDPAYIEGTNTSAVLYLTGCEL